MFKLFIFSVIFLLIWGITKLFGYIRKNDEYNRGTDGYNRNPEGYNKGSTSNSRSDNEKQKKSKSNLFSRLFEFKPSLPFDEEAITWCADFIAIDEKQLRLILKNIPACYRKFSLRKRSGGHRIICAPQQPLSSIQQTIYRRILLPVNIHPAATGFRHGVSIVHNAKPHLGKRNILKTDITDFFGTIKQYTVIKAFEKIGYPTNVSEVLAELCCLDKRLPQGASTSPVMSNIVAYEMDKKLTALSNENGLIYTRYADDLTFSGDYISQDTLLAGITKILGEEGFVLQRKKTRFISANKRKIITGISISSGEKLTIPKKQKRELRKNIHFILTKGLVSHQRHIKSTDPTYLKRLIGYLSYWHSVEPDNKYVIDSLNVLKKIEKKSR